MMPPPRRLPPGPRLPALAQTVLSLARPVEFLERCRRHYGGAFTIDTYLLGRIVHVVHPELVREVFTGDPDVLHAGEANVALRAVMGPRSVMILDGKEHVRERKLMMPPFHGERAASWAQTMHEITARCVESWQPGARFAIYPEMQRITLEVILRLVFGVEDGGQLAELGEALTRLLDRHASTIDSLFTLPAFQRSLFGLSPWDRFVRDRDRADALVHRQIARRRTARGTRADVLSMLLEAHDDAGRAMTDAELRDELVTLLVAGHETTATMLSWAFDYILGDQRVRAELERELAGASRGGELDLHAVAKLPYLDATIKEVLRLRPVVPGVGRRLTRAIRLGEFEIPAGELVVPIAFLTHRLPELYPEPEAFRPERFVGVKPDPYAWYPFGGGARRCLGMMFAYQEMKIVLATVLSRARLHKPRAELAPIAMRGVTMVPKGGVEVIADSRLHTDLRSARVSSG